MAIRTGAEYIESLRDGREVWLGGQRVTDVPTHPAFRGCVDSIARLYDMQHEPAYADILTFDAAGERHALSYREPRAAADLVRLRRMIEFVARYSGGTLARAPEYVPLILLGLCSIQDQLGQDNPAH